jgi:choline kinase
VSFKMQIVIPMSGFGERFKRAGYDVPKPLIEVEGKPIIAHVIDMFPDEPDHLADPRYRMREILESYCPTGIIVPIAAHKRGPIHAVLQVRDRIRDDAPVVVNYCDFTCYWDYAHFRRWVRETGCDGAVPAYRGFHPHSLGSTFYAYMRQTDGWASDIQEKTPFTDKPHEEYASSGTYYFASGALMKWAFDETVRRDLSVNSEYYASLAYKPLFDAGKRVAVYELQHFMQWGTPQDVAEYNQQSRGFHLLTGERPQARQAGATLIPMAGSGSRFVKEGYAVPKPLIEVSGVAMAVAATRDLPAAERQVFVLRRDLPQLDVIVPRLTAAYPDARLVMLDKLTDGQAVTCLEALGEVDLDAPLTIGACDNGLLYDPHAFERLMADASVDVIVWGYRGHANAQRKPQFYGWIQEEGGRVTGVSVKKPLSDPVHDPIIVGAFTFRRARDFKTAAERLIARDGRVNGEFYVDTCIEDAIAAGLNVRLFDVDSYLCWGTPDELKTFEYWQSCFHKWAGHPYTLARDGRVRPDAVDGLERRYATRRPPTL